MPCNQAEQRLGMVECVSYINYITYISYITYVAYISYITYMVKEIFTKVYKYSSYTKVALKFSMNDLTYHAALSKLFLKAVTN